MAIDLRKLVPMPEEWEDRAEEWNNHMNWLTQVFRPAYLTKAATREGANCPGCHRDGKITPRTIGISEARYLLLIRRVYGPATFKQTAAQTHWTREYPSQGVPAAGFYAMSPDGWGFVEPIDPEDPAYPGRGYWRITARGEAFLRGAEVEGYRYFYNKKSKIAHGRPTTTISQALSQPDFDLDSFLDDSVDPDDHPGYDDSGTSRNRRPVPTTSST